MSVTSFQKSMTILRDMGQVKSRVRMLKFRRTNFRFFK